MSTLIYGENIAKLIYNINSKFRRWQSNKKGKSAAQSKCSRVAHQLTLVCSRPCHWSITSIDNTLLQTRQCSNQMLLLIIHISARYMCSCNMPKAGQDCSVSTGQGQWNAVLHEPEEPQCHKYGTLSYWKTNVSSATLWTAGSSCFDSTLIMVAGTIDSDAWLHINTRPIQPRFDTGVHSTTCDTAVATSSFQSGQFWAMLTASVTVSLWDSRSQSGWFWVMLTASVTVSLWDSRFHSGQFWAMLTASVTVSV